MTLIIEELEKKMYKNATKEYEIWQITPNAKILSYTPSLVFLYAYLLNWFHNY